MSSTKAECQTLIEAVMPFAERMLRQHGALAPYGGALMADGEITLIGTADMDADIDPNEKIALLQGAMKRGARAGEYSATAVVHDAKARLPNAVEKQDVIVMYLDHRDQVSNRIVFPYHFQDGHLKIGRSMSFPGESLVFPRS